MNEAQKNKKNHVWKQGVIALGLSTAMLTGGILYQGNNLKETMDALDKQTNTLNETKSKVEIQNGEIKALFKANKSLEQAKQDQSDTIMDLTNNLREAGDKVNAQQKKIKQLEADLKKKRASRAKTSAAPATASVNGMQKFRSTAYSYGTTTASGTHVREGRTIAVDPRLIPLGTQVKIVCPDYPSINGVYTAEDTGRVIKGNIIDVYINGKTRALDFGRRTIYVDILN